MIVSLRDNFKIKAQEFERFSKFSFEFIPKGFLNCQL